ncbi:MAG TPA: efflux RND transporter periplasmic adaptor subunit [Candidatus Sumerlaeia bacterium]|nr:MAG: Macrolide export protein MacA [candidate division BRC1 bacterium ADurb.Bin183]HRR32173.1 efflux RND transporter periplasmic adaptor subunit [Candidatus Sumerlaeia bacterium]HRR98821.1 efflux RND transporter periplasmic adaptor subunit [Candidatus Sumerlaeia bacterium]
MRRVLKFILKIIILLVAAAFIIYWMKFAPIKVSVLDIQQGQVIAEAMGTGTLTARIQTTISPKIQGRLIDLTVDQNDAVTTGQLLAAMDDSDLREQVAIAKANLEAAEASLNRLLAEEEKAKAVITQARLEHSRSSKLVDTGAIATSSADKSLEQLQVAEAEGVRAAAAIIEAKKQIAAVERTLRYHEAKLADSKIYSPFEGLITRRDRDIGDVVVPGSSIYQLISTGEIWVSAWVDESMLTFLRQGQNARLVFRSEPNKNYAGTVVRISREVDRETREFLVDVDTGELPRNWALGQRVEVFIETGKKEDAVRLPRNRVRWSGGKAGVFIISEGRAVWRNLRLGMTGGEFVEVLSGLSNGDRVVVASEKDFLKIKTGRRVVASP